ATKRKTSSADSPRSDRQKDWKAVMCRGARIRGFSPSGSAVPRNWTKAQWRPNRALDTLRAVAKPLMRRTTATRPGIRVSLPEGECPTGARLRYGWPGETVEEAQMAPSKHRRSAGEALARALLAAALASVTGLGACKKKQEAPPAPPPTVEV